MKTRGIESQSTAAAGQAHRPMRLWPLLAAIPLVIAIALMAGAAGMGFPDWNTPTGRAILLLRCNRVWAGFLVGAGLAGAGVVLQALLRNPLAEPYVLGVSSGAGLGAALAVFFGLASVSVLSLPLMAFTGGALTLGLVYALAAGGRGAPSLYGLLLSGVIVNSMGSSLLMLIVSLAPVEGMHSILWWMLGSFQMSSELMLKAGTVIIAAGLVALMLLGRAVNALTLGREMAHHLGVRTGAVIAVCLLLATMLTAAAVALSGIIGFVGLIVPHAARSWAGPDHRRLPAVAALMGGLFLVVADTLARTVLAPREIPIGVITALIGGPFFLILLHRRRKEGWVE